MRAPSTLVPLLALLIAPALRAADGRIPIAAAPYTISAPGAYYLTKDLAPASGTAISINADGVTIDLENHMITALAGGYGIYAQNHTELTVLNGRINGGAYGIYFYVNAVTPANPVYRVEGVTVAGSTANGITAYSSLPGNRQRVIFRGNRTIKIAGVGIFVQYADHSVIQDNVTEEVTTGASGGGSCISVLVISNSVISGNLASQCQTEGLAIFQGSNNRIEGNHVAGAGSAGLRVYNAANGNTILNNSVSSSASGVNVVGNGNLVDGNTVSSCTGQAISVSGNNNAYANNHTMNNTTNGVTLAGGTGNFNGGGNY